MDSIFDSFTFFVLNTELEDDDTPTGGISFYGETVSDFLKDTDLPCSISVSELNKHLVACGIRPINNGYKCGGCVRCEKRDRPNETGYHCTAQNYTLDIDPENEACCAYWDKAEQEKLDRIYAEKFGAEKQERWKIYSKKPPVKLPIVFDGFGMIPVCPVCKEETYSTEQCNWCGQRFIQDEEIEEYNRPGPEETIICVICGQKTLTGVRSKYNGHFHGCCKSCGAVIME